MSEAPRTFFAHAMIALGAVVGVQMMLVQPAQQQAGEVREQVREMTQQVAQINDPSSNAALLQRREEKALVRIDALERDNSYVDPADLVTLVQHLGSETGVRVERIDPETLHPRTGVRKGDKRAAQLPTEAVSLRIEARGTYRQIARFVAGVESRPGYTRTDEVTLRPTMSPGKDEVGVSIRTAQLAFDLEAFKPVPATEGMVP